MSLLRPDLSRFLILCIPLANMSRHNRRRTRASQRKSPSSPQFPDFELCEKFSTIDLPDPKQLSPTGLTRARTKRNDLAARHWHNRYMAWQARERRQREERDKLLADQRRIFGGESGEDDEDGLCSNMMEYFVGLDFIMETDGRQGS
ncbi:MAG: hypothetical protein Q9181_000466 [Wetmoreana brouardii]